MLVSLKLLTWMVLSCRWVELRPAAEAAKDFGILLLAFRFILLSLFIRHLLRMFIEHMYIQIVTISEVLTAVPALLGCLTSVTHDLSLGLLSPASAGWTVHLLCSDHLL